ncbi:YtxH domain-containing protein [Acidithiobacillus sp. IBUN Pt1247-S3]|uniref:YtxH domain-containing protein n=1 Tax=Acidithiobacillus sp. IBUN Pt1247-S3 TaxID=3166642 RepID=UPI0034E3AE58
MKNSAAGFVMGLLVGAAAGVLLAPASGAETRDDLRRSMQRGREQLRELETLAEERITRLIDEIQEKTQQLLASGGELMDAKRQDLQEAIQVAKRALAEEREIMLRSRRERQLEAEIDQSED